MCTQKAYGVSSIDYSFIASAAVNSSSSLREEELLSAWRGYR